MPHHKVKLARDLLPRRTEQLREPTKSNHEFPYPWRTAEDVPKRFLPRIMLRGRKRLPVAQLRRDKAATAAHLIPLCTS